MITEDRVREDNLLSGLELMAALSLARFKDPGFSQKYEFPFDVQQLENDLEDFYPLELFEELYDPPSARRDDYIIKEFNPGAGFALREWVLGSSWVSLRKRVCHEKFAEGDLVNLIYRSATYLQSMAQARITGLSDAARSLRDEILREPLTPAIRLEDSAEVQEITKEEI
jgi:hypothetical protein